jgi:hypothetical protein
MFPLIAIAALVALMVYAAQSSAGTAATPTLDANLPDSLKATVLAAIKSETDPTKLRALEATLVGYPKSQAALEAQAKILDGLAQQSTDQINALLLSIKDPSIRTKIQQVLMTTTDQTSLELLAAFMSVGEPSAAAVLRVKIAALQGKTVYTPPVLPPVVNSPNAFNLFSTGQYQGCDQQPSCNVSAAQFGNGPGPLGLDSGITGLSPEAGDVLAGLLVALPASFAQQFPLAPVVQGDPTGTFAQTCGAVEAVIRGPLPIAATSLRYKQAYLVANQAALNAAANVSPTPASPAATTSPAAAASAAVQQAQAAMAMVGGLQILGEGPDWLRAQDPEHGYPRQRAHLTGQGIGPESGEMAGWAVEQAGWALQQAGLGGHRGWHTGNFWTIEHAGLGGRRGWHTGLGGRRGWHTGGGGGLPDLSGQGIGPESGEMAGGGGGLPDLSGGGGGLPDLSGQRIGPESGEMAGWGPHGWHSGRAGRRGWHTGERVGPETVVMAGQGIGPESGEMAGWAPDWRTPHGLPALSGGNPEIVGVAPAPSGGWAPVWAHTGRRVGPGSGEMTGRRVGPGSGEMTGRVGPGSGEMTGWTFQHAAMTGKSATGWAPPWTAHTGWSPAWTQAGWAPTWTQAGWLLIPQPQGAHIDASQSWTGKERFAGTEKPATAPHLLR